MVCTDDWEPRQPQDYVRGKAEKQTPPWTRSKPGDTFIVIPTTAAIAGIAISGLALTGTGWSVGEVPPSSFTL